MEALTINEDVVNLVGGRHFSSCKELIRAVGSSPETKGRFTPGGTPATGLRSSAGDERAGLLNCETSGRDEKSGYPLHNHGIMQYQRVVVGGSSNEMMTR